MERKNISPSSALAENILVRKFNERLDNMTPEEQEAFFISDEEARALGFDPEAEAAKPDWVKRSELAAVEVQLEALELSDDED